jgi:predicted regulator of Ras-like GTPase activity (Roadblock/LC7/MglB family)
MRSKHRLSLVASLPSGRPAPGVAGESPWRSLTLRARQAIDQGDLGQARQLYEEALSQADGALVAAQLPANDQSVCLAPAQYHLACRNIAELARRQGDSGTEGIFIYRAYSRLIELAESVRAPLALRSSAVNQLDGALRALDRYIAQHGPSETLEGQTERVRAVTAAVLRLAEAAGVELAPAGVAQSGVWTF